MAVGARRSGRLPAFVARALQPGLPSAAPCPEAVGRRDRAPFAALRDPLAWQVTAFMGLQSSLAYVLFGWLPAILQGRGLSALDAGLVASVVTLHQAPGALVVAMLAARVRDQRG